MDREERRLLTRIAESIERIACIEEQINKNLNTMNQPESKFKRGLDLAGACVSVLGIFTIADVIRQWLMGR
jgi:hypothetical protein